ncbi:MAG: hypothetical protein ACK2U2_15685 [Anaerolineae bacterium]|jgi:hypothetical protein
MRKEYELAEAAATEAVTIAPNYADGYGVLALIKNALGGRLSGEQGTHLQPRQDR